MKKQPFSVLLLGMLAGLLWLLIPGVVSANDLPDGKHFGVFEMLEGQGVELCEACFKALEAMPSDLTGCERPYDPELGFSAPAWTELDPLKRLDLVKEVRLFVTPIEKENIPGSIYDGDNFEREIRRLMKQERAALSLTTIDVDNDGYSEPVLKFRDGVCGDPQPRSATFQALMVLSPDRKAINRTKTDVVTQNERKRPERPAGGVYSQIYDIFEYKGRFYFDKWDNDVLEPDTFSIYQAVVNKVTKVCKYRYERRWRSQAQVGKQ